MTVIAGLIVRMRAAGVEPVMIFDGKSPAAKAPVVAARRIVREAAHKEISEIESTIAAKPEMPEIERAALERRAADLQLKAPRINRDDKDELRSFYTRRAYSLLRRRRRPMMCWHFSVVKESYRQ